MIHLIAQTIGAALGIAALTVAITSFWPSQDKEHLKENENAH